MYVSENFPYIKGGIKGGINSEFIVYKCGGDHLCLDADRNSEAPRVPETCANDIPNYELLTGFPLFEYTLYAEWDLDTGFRHLSQMMQ